MDVTASGLWGWWRRDRGRGKSAVGDETVIDPIAEAEVYAAYGRTTQAIDVLEQALRRSPSDLRVAKKLEELKGTGTGAGFAPAPAIEQAMVLAKKLSPESQTLVVVAIRRLARLESRML